MKRVNAVKKIKREAHDRLKNVSGKCYGKVPEF